MRTSVADISLRLSRENFVVRHGGLKLKKIKKIFLVFREIVRVSIASPANALTASRDSQNERVTK